ncbi:MAG: hypothetical protein JNM31_01085 [Flavobacteriales bacterium]|nr:hypothetical protein [Flavobacteriales bacterium]
MSVDPIFVRNMLLVSLSLIFLYMLYSRYRQQVRLRDVPVARHAELITLEVAYHPARLRVHVRVRAPEETVRLRLLGEGHAAVREWPQVPVGSGDHWLELPLDQHKDGTYRLEMSTSTQRTERSFRLQQA